jgi:hypothetical protein
MKIHYTDGREFELEYNPDKHSYVVDGNKIPSVTRVIDSCFPKYLVDWAVQEGADFFLQSIEPYRKPDPATFFIPYRVVEHIHQGILTASKAISEHAADVGNEVHHWISEGIKWKMGKRDEPLEIPEEDEEVSNCIQAFIKWASENEIEWIATEEKIYYDDDENTPAKYSYAGTVDAIAIVNGTPCIIDFKTSKKVYKPYYLQLAAYQYAARLMYQFDTTPKGIILRLDKGSGAYEEKKFDPTGHIETFFNCLDIRQWSSKRIKQDSWGYSKELRGPDNGRHRKVGDSVG